MRRIGLYGGTFSPPHNGHLHALSSFLRAEKPDAAIVMPTFVPPHKIREEETSAEDRLAMAKLAFAQFPDTEVSDLEIRRGGKSYTALTLEALSAFDTRILLLCGTDMFLTLDSWYHPETIFRLADVVCMVREDGGETREQMREKAGQYEREYGAVCRFLPADPLPLSSAGVREKIRTGGLAAAKDLVPPAVYAYMEEKGLYQS